MAREESGRAEDRRAGGSRPAGGHEPAADSAVRDRATARRVAIFEDRYGPGSYERLLTWLQQPCVSFAQIAARLHVTRERVRQWQLLLMPGAPTGHERRRRCLLVRQQQRLLADRLFAAFYRDVREHAKDARLEPIRSRDGYRTRMARVDGRLVAIREATRLEPTPSARSSPSYRLTGYRGNAEFVYVRLDADGFLVLPATVLPQRGTTFTGSRAQRYQPFTNTFHALRTGTRRLA